MKIRCIKDVIMTRDQTREFTEGKVYEVNANGNATNDSGDPLHVIGTPGRHWFDEHFKEIRQKELYTLEV